MDDGPQIEPGDFHMAYPHHENESSTILFTPYGVDPSHMAISVLGRSKDLIREI